MTDESKIEKAAPTRTFGTSAGAPDNVNSSRRSFITGTAMAATGLLILPRHVLGGPRYTAPSDRLNIAGIGVGGMGAANMRALASENIVALCDVDWGYTDKSFRTMFAGVGDLQARLAKAPRPSARSWRTGSRRRNGWRGSSMRSSATPTTARCSSSRRTSTRW